ncbi:MAG TPA: XdhC family protein [Rectinemataceae bacterium]|nr:XdhC family protein [Rectinemataceae bacterium]
MSYEVLSALARSPGAAMVVVVDVQGSVPRHVGSKMAIFPDLTTRGTVGGGQLEARAIEEARRCISTASSAAIKVELTGAEALGATPVCGGVAELWIEYNADPAPFGLALHELDAGRMVVLVSERRGGQPRCCFALDRTGSPLVSVDAGAVRAAAAPAVAAAIRDGRATFDAAAGLFYDPVLPPERLLILGGGHVGLAVAQFAVNLDFRVSIADEREEFAASGRFPAGVETLHGNYVETIESYPFGPSTYALVVTPGHLKDLECVRAALGREYRYLGLIGSKRKVRMIMEQLITEGLDASRVEALYSPVGLDIGAETPEEIAVSILAEMIAVRRGSSALAAIEADRRRRRG